MLCGKKFLKSPHYCDTISITLEMKKKTESIVVFYVYRGFKEIRNQEERCDGSISNLGRYISIMLSIEA